jgi:hypothetical protein
MRCKWEWLLYTGLLVCSEQEQGQQHIQLYRQEGGMGHLASQLLIVNQTVWILWWGDPFESWVKVIYAKVQHWPHIILKNNARHRIKTIY